jgi:hypothetical protein
VLACLGRLSADGEEADSGAETTDGHRHGRLRLNWGRSRRDGGGRCTTLRCVDLRDTERVEAGSARTGWVAPALDCSMRGRGRRGEGAGRR